MGNSGSMRADDGEDLLAGYVTGPAAATEATTMALAGADAARAVVLVEGISDQIAVETLAVILSHRPTVGHGPGRRHLVSGGGLGGTACMDGRAFDARVSS